MADVGILAAIAGTLATAIGIVLFQHLRRVQIRMETAGAASADLSGRVKRLEHDVERLIDAERRPR